VAVGLGVAGVAVLAVGGLLYARHRGRRDAADLDMKASAANLDTLSISHDTRTNGEWFEDQSNSTHPHGSQDQQQHQQDVPQANARTDEEHDDAI
jgi:hypothetical protein